MAIVIAGAGTVPAAAQPETGAALADLSIEQLGNIEITSVSRRAQPLFDAPGSLFVITAADIRRSGAASLPEALRLAPNLQVARSSNTGYSISARAVDSALSNKLLVLIDGRSVYTPLYSGVFWDAQDVMLEDVDRIEVISGAGATVWGVNAVNGVINIVTRSAADRQGRLASADLGGRSRRVALRTGGRSAGGLHYSVHGLHHEQSGNRIAAGAPARDAARHGQVGLRVDMALGAGALTLVGDASRGRFDQAPGTVGTLGTEKSGTNLLARFERPWAGGTLTLQAHAEHTRRTSVPILDDRQDIVDVQVQHAGVPLGDHLLSWGVEVRRGRNRSANSRYLAFLPPLLAQTWSSVHVQDELSLSPAWRVTAGLRVERNDYTGTEYLPALRAAWKWDPRHMLWASAARAVRAPARLDRDFHVPGEAPFQLRGGPGFRSEVAKDFELGWRSQFGEDVTLSMTAFRTDYDRLRALRLDPNLAGGIVSNDIRARSHGIEAWGSFQALRGWRLHAGAALLRQRAELLPGGNDPGSVASLVGGNPRHWWTLRSSHDLGSQWELDLLWRGVAQRAAGAVPSYQALSIHMSWKPQADWRLSLGLRDWNVGGHAEFGAAATRAVFKPDAHAKVEYRF